MKFTFTDYVEFKIWRNENDKAHKASLAEAWVQYFSLLEQELSREDKAWVEAFLQAPKAMAYAMLTQKMDFSK